MIEKKEFEVAKELGDILDLISEIIKVVKNKGDYTSLLDDLIKAVNGIGDIPEEFKNKKAIVITCADTICEIVEIFTEKK